MNIESCESFIQFCDDMTIATPANEGIISPDEKSRFSIKHGEDARQAKELRSKAKVEAKHGNYNKAISLTSKAMAIYSNLKKTANAIPDKNTTSGIKFSDGSDSYKGVSKTAALDWCNRMISTCQAELLKYKNASKRR